MSIETDVLNALLKLARRRSSRTVPQSPSLDQLVRAVGNGTDESIIRRALFSLAKSGLIQRTAGGLALTLPGLAIAAAAGSGSEPRPRNEREAAATKIAEDEKAAAKKAGAAKQLPLTVRRRRAA